MPGQIDVTTLVGNPVPRIQVYPSTALRDPLNARPVISRVQEVEMLAELAEVEQDDWQYNVMEGITCLSDRTYWNPYLPSFDDPSALGREEPCWAANEYGVVVSRQNGKGTIIELKSLADLFLWGVREVIYTSHHYRTMTDMFERMEQLVMNLVKNDPDAKKMLGNVMRGNGTQGIYMRDGRKMVFMARSKSSVRGMSPDVLILDEAMMKLGVEEVRAARPAVSARPNYQILNFGSAGNAEAVYFGAVRNYILPIYERGEKFGDENPDTGWSEYSEELHTNYCEPNCTKHRDPADPMTWIDTNPSLGNGRLRIETIKGEYEKIGRMDMDAFALDRLSDPKHWPREGGGWAVIPKDAWDIAGDHDLHMGDKFILSVDTAPDEEWTCLTACGATEEDGELAMVEITADAESDEMDYRPGVLWAFERIVKIYQASKFAFVAIDPSTPAGVLIPKLEAKHIPVKEITGRAYNLSCGEFLRAVHPKKGEKARIVHSSQAPMTTAAANAEKKDRVELWSWDKLTESTDITPITSATKAYGVYMAHLYRKKVVPFFFVGD